MPDNHTPTTDEQGKTLIENKLNELYGSHDFLGHVINTIPDLVWMKDTNGIYLLGNAALEKFFGVTQKGFLGKSDFDFMDEADANLCKQSDETAIKSDNISFSEEKVLNSDNKEVILEIRKIAVRDVSGELLGIMGIATDITERRLAEEVTAKSEQEFRTLTENLPDNIVRYNLDCRVTYVSPAIERIGGKDAVAMLMGKTPMESHFILNDEQAKMYQHCLEQTIATGEINEMELTTTPVHAGEVQIHHIRFVPEHLPSGEICGAMAIGRDITEQKKIEGVLQHKQSMLTEAQRLAVLGSWDWDVIKNKVEWSEMAYEIYTPDKHPADPNFEDFTSSLHEDDKERVIAAVVSAFEHDTPFDLDHRVVSKSKGVRTVHAHGKVFRDKDGKPIRMIGTVHDITERKASEKMLRMLSDSLNVTSESVFIVDLDSAQMIYVNDTAARTLEYSREELLSGMSVFDLDPDFDHDKWKAHMLDIKNHGAVTIETKHRTKSGRVYPVEVTAHYFEYDGKVYNLAVTRDITERIEKELLLRKKEYEYRTLASNLPGTLVRYDKECRFVFVNRVFENSLGIVLEDIKGKKPTEVKNLKESAFFESIVQKCIDAREIISFEHNVETVDGSFYGVVKITPEFDSAGEVEFVQILTTDITHRKELENALKTREQSFRTLAENTPDAIARYDINCKTTYANKSYANAFGMCQTGEIIGQKPSSTIKTVEVLAYEEAIKQVFIGGHAEEFELQLDSCDEKARIVQIKIVPEYDSDKSIKSVLAVGRDLTRIREAEKEVEYLAFYDNLTGLPNRVLAKDRAAQMLARAKRTETKAAILFADLDNFKNINDTMGHSVGDTLLKLVAQRLLECVRESDTVTRQGGDEFLILLPDIVEIDSVVNVADKITKELKAPFYIDGKVFVITVSIGIALLPDDGDEFDMLLKKADMAMYEAKNIGKNSYCFFTQSISIESINHMQLFNDLRYALERGEFEIYYQPQIKISDKSLVGAEALLRWKHPDKGYISPVEFIPVAESGGMIIEIGSWVLREVCNQAAQWQKAGYPPMVVAVNISAMQFKRGNLLQTVKAALSESGLAAEYLELELTESIIIKNTESVLQTVRQLKELGIKLSIDDFGTGYSSLSYLKRFAVDKLKIDKSFIMDLVHDHENAAIVRAVVQMAGSLNLTTIAEGVESTEVLDALSAYGCDEVQGYLFSKPIPAVEFESGFCRHIIEHHLTDSTDKSDSHAKRAYR